MYRVEDKFHCEKKDLYILQNRLNAILESDHADNEDGYIITSVYFDDIYDSCLWDTIDGNYKREKYRIRIYNHSFDVIKLEIKYKENSRIYKKTKVISKDEMFTLLKGECITCDATTLNDPIMLFNMAIKNRGFRPKVIVEYDRRAFIYKPGNVRITLDRGLRVSRQIDLFGKEEIPYMYTKEWQDVLEVKYDEFIPDFITQLIEFGNMRQVSFSKYQICRQEIGEYK
ncbi:MAG: polyphosphate polymerase domain-containing protein [Lachnospiraceae bacterium]|nr:polyphosphate polymerase domain-containing protein [Lachnospiraceae bacterium]